MTKDSAINYRSLDLECPFNFYSKVWGKYPDPLCPEVDGGYTVAIVETDLSNQQFMSKIICCNCYAATVVDRSHGSGIVSGVGS